VQKTGHSIAVGLEPGRGMCLRINDMVSHHEGVLEELQACQQQQRCEREDAASSVLQPRGKQAAV
jgi:hypothetical protein